MDNSAKVIEITEKYGHLEGEALLEPLIYDYFSDKTIGLVSSFGAESALLLDMAAKIKPDIPIIFLNTKKLFPATLTYKETLISYLGLTDVREIFPDYSDTSRMDSTGLLWQRDARACCTIRKVKPLQKALKGLEAWITGRKRYHGGLRSDMPLIETFEGRIKINPLANWTAEMIAAEFKKRNLPEHPLKEKGFLSSGCIPCTDLPVDPNDPRSGRWKNNDDKTECGIHLSEDGTLTSLK